MKRYVALAALAALATGPVWATDVGVSVNVSQPGVYGRIDIGRFPQPQLVVAQPVIVMQPRVIVAQPAEPMYLHVPPGHRRNWRRHCHRYDACGSPVYFVRDDWYQRQVMVEHREQRGRGHGGRGHNRRHGDD